VYVRYVDSSSLGFSLSSYRQSHIGLVISSRFILIINKNKLDLIVRQKICLNVVLVLLVKVSNHDPLIYMCT
jgi:hypothetical protein